VATRRKYRPRAYREGAVVTPMPADAVPVDNIIVAPPIEAAPAAPPVSPATADKVKKFGFLQNLQWPALNLRVADFGQYPMVAVRI
jgi:hypothetical protein